MNGAQSLLRTLVGSGVSVCFGNPGTSEMHFVAALDDVPEMRAVLCLFEGVTTGAADGYARMADRPAATLLHLGPGLTNALANVHNARKAHVPMLNVVGEHATDHRAKNAPLSSDIEGLARPLSHWFRCTERASDLPRDAAEAVAAALTPPGQIATLVLPADVSWSDSGEPAARAVVPSRRVIDDAAIERAAAALAKGTPSALLLGGVALRAESLAIASRIAVATGARVLCDTFTGRLERGAGRAPIERLPYFAEAATQSLASVRELLLFGTEAPVSFFAYPNKPAELLHGECTVHAIATVAQDLHDALERLAERVGAKPGTERVQAPQLLGPSQRPKLDAKAVAETLALRMPENAIVVDEGGTEGFLAPVLSQGAPPHDWLSNTGGSIGMGLPMAVGAAVACPDRTVICLEGDGSAMYTLQALWTQAREGLRVINIVLANRSYRILNVELERVGAERAGGRARQLLRIDGPELDFVALATGMGVQAQRVDTPAAFDKALQRALAAEGPCLIEAVID
jgi:acetolactate synthase-1/2/3 large subunit